MILHQMLHGYSQGHNLLASSIILPYEEDMDLVFTQSDWDEYSSPYDKDSSYLTIYPLKKSGYLVVAKSWYAHEMDRPGCVWTQSLLVKIDEIEQEFNFEELLDVFRRPQKDKYGLYTQPILVNSVDFKSVLLAPTISNNDVGRLLVNLAQKKTGATFRVEMNTIEYQKLVLRLLQYLPTELLRETSICSGTLLQRKIDGHPFSLQFTPQSGNSLASSKVDNNDIVLLFWSASVHDDLRSLFKLTRLFSKDIGDSYEKLMASIKLIYLLLQAYQEGKEVKMEMILDIIITAFPAKEDGATVKLNFLRQSVSKIFCTESHFVYLLCTMQNNNAFDYEAIGFYNRIKEFRQNDTDGEYQHLIVNLLTSYYLNQTGTRVMREGLNYLSDDILKQFALEHWDNYLAAIKTFDYLLEARPVWIDFERHHFKEVYSVFVQEQRPAFMCYHELLKRLLAYDIDFSNEINKGLYIQQEDIVNVIWDYYNNSNKLHVLEGARTITSEKYSDFLAWIGRQSDYSPIVCSYILEIVNPESDMVRSKGSSIWRMYANKIGNNKIASGVEGVDYLVFLFLLSFNWKDDYALTFLRISFNRLHHIFSTGYEDKKVWKPLRYFLYGFWWWEYWDKCKMLRVGVVRYLISIGKTISLLDDFCELPVLTKDMKEIWKKETENK